MTVSYRRFPAVSAVPPRPVVTLPRRGLYRRLFKRIFDVMAILLALPVVVPLIAALAFAVSRDGGQAFYSQHRIGRNGRAFRMWKLRTMVVDAEARMVQHLATHPEARAEWDARQKLENDPRITRFGRFLRKSSLDELPQLWNVLTGDMSLIGPRPMMMCQQALYPGTAYYALRPGITGSWQVAGRNSTTFEARAEFDTTYERGLSFFGDMKILLRTVRVVFAGTGC